jgi:hypothetical protein
MCPQHLNPGTASPAGRSIQQPRELGAKNLWNKKWGSQFDSYKGGKVWRNLKTYERVQQTAVHS